MNRTFSTAGYILWVLRWNAAGGDVSLIGLKMRRKKYHLNRWSRRK